MSKLTAVEFLAERYNYITWMRNRDKISEGTADEWRAKFLKEAKEMEKEQITNAHLHDDSSTKRFCTTDLLNAYQAGAVKMYTKMVNSIEKQTLMRLVKDSQEWLKLYDK